MPVCNVSIRRMVRKRRQPKSRLGEELQPAAVKTGRFAAMNPDQHRRPLPRDPAWRHPTRLKGRAVRVRAAPLSEPSERGPYPDLLKSLVNGRDLPIHILPLSCAAGPSPNRLHLLPVPRPIVSSGDRSVFPPGFDSRLNRAASNPFVSIVRGDSGNLAMAMEGNDATTRT